MTEEYVNQLKFNRERIEIIRLNNNELLQQHKSNLITLENKCDHKMPDGSSGFKEDNFCLMCKVIKII